MIANQTLVKSVSPVVQLRLHIKSLYTLSSNSNFAPTSPRRLTPYLARTLLPAVTRAHRNVDAVLLE